jgi:hypothetical protein
VQARIGKKSNMKERTNMIRQQLRVALLAGGILAALSCTVRADDAGKAPDPCAPAYRTITVNEWVPEQYQATRTVYKQESHQETYTAYRCESVPETRTRTVTCYTRVPEMRNEVRRVCVKVPCWEERTVCEKHWVTVPETKTIRKCVDRGHYECQEVQCGPSLGERFRGMLSCKKDCCDPCANSCCEPCPRTKTVKVWCPNKCWEEQCVTVCKKVCETRQCTKKVCVMKTEWKEECHQVCHYVCKPECKTETYTVCCKKQIPYQATRCVTKCVPVCENYTACRMVCRKVEKQVACAPACEPCCNPCNNSCNTCCRQSLFSGLKGRLAGFGHKNSCCDSGCNSSCGCN